MKYGSSVTDWFSDKKSYTVTIELTTEPAGNNAAAAGNNEAAADNNAAAAGGNAVAGGDTAEAADDNAAVWFGMTVIRMDWSSLWGLWGTGAQG